MHPLLIRARNALFRRGHPRRPYHIHRLRLFASLAAGIVGASVFLRIWYFLLPALPPASGPWHSPPPPSFVPGGPVVSAPAVPRFDLSQFVGTLVDPPYPSPTTGLIGLAVLFGTLTLGGVAYAIVLAWGVTRSSFWRGLGLGVATFVGMGLAVWLGVGYDPAVMRNAIPDPGFFLLGWSVWASASLLLGCLAYGGVVGAIYRYLCR